MKIAQPTESMLSGTSLKQDLELFIQQPGPEQLAVCQGCQQHAGDKCSASCREAPKALSIDPVKYPIERNVVAFVYELAATRLLKTCWSCEGHMDAENNLWKVPQVCFYSTSPAYVKLLSRYLGELQQQANLTYRWHIVIIDFAQTDGLTYSVQPDLNIVKDPHLGMLQNDLRIIADGLHLNLKQHARKLISSMAV